MMQREVAGENQGLTKKNEDWTKKNVDLTMTHGNPSGTLLENKGELYSHNVIQFLGGVHMHKK